MTGQDVLGRAKRSLSKPQFLASVTWVLCVAAGAACREAAAETVIDTTPFWNGVDEVSAYGEPAVATVGQTFSVSGGDSTLMSFTFWLDDRIAPDQPGPSRFAGYVMQWDASQSRATGPLLYQSAMATTTTNNSGLDGMESFVFDTGALSLSAGMQYVAFISASQFYDGIEDAARVGAITVLGPVMYPDVYAGGNFASLNNGNDFNAVGTMSWNEEFGQEKIDLAFRAVLVPEPTTIALAVSAAAWLGFVRAPRILRRLLRVERKLGMACGRARP